MGLRGALAAKFWSHARSGERATRDCIVSVSSAYAGIQSVVGAELVSPCVGAPCGMWRVPGIVAVIDSAAAAGAPAPRAPAPLNELSLVAPQVADTLPPKARG